MAHLDLEGMRRRLLREQAEFDQRRESVREEVDALLRDGDCPLGLAIYELSQEGSPIMRLLGSLADIGLHSIIDSMCHRIDE